MLFKILLLILLLYVLGHLLMVTVTMIVSYVEGRNLYNQDGWRPGDFDDYPKGILVAFGKEFLSQLCTVTLAPFGFVVNMDRARNEGLGNEAPPVLFVHGLSQSSMNWNWLIQKLRAKRRDRRFYTMNLRPVFGSIDGSAEQLHQRVEEVLRATGQGTLSLVGHSMGGLVIRAYLAKHGTQKVDKVFTIGTPHHGSRLAVLLPFWANLREMTPGSAWLKQQAKGDRVREVAFTSIYSVHDNLVVPYHSARLEGAVHVPLTEVGHLGLLVDQRTLDVLERGLFGDNA